MCRKELRIFRLYEVKGLFTMIITKLENELKELKVRTFSTYDDIVNNNEKINHLEKQIMIMKSISNVIIRRRQRGANAIDIENYKQKLLYTWRNNETVKSHITEII